MPDFSDAFDPFLLYQISSVVTPTELHAQMSKHTGTKTATTLLVSALRCLEEKVQRLEQSHGTCISTITHALEVLGGVQSELNLHRGAAASYRRIVHYNDILDYQWSSMSMRAWRRAEVLPLSRSSRNLEALFNLGLQLNKCFDHIEAEVALRRLIPLVRTAHGDNSFQYRNSIEQLMYALKGQGCQAGVIELWQEYCRSQDDEISKLLSTQSGDLSQDGVCMMSDTLQSGDLYQQDLQYVPFTGDAA